MVVKKVTPNEEVVEMGEGEGGIYHPIAVVKVEDQSRVHNDVMRDLPRWFPAMYEIVDGFVMGLGAIENFMMNMRRMKRRVRNGKKTQA